MGLKVSGRPSCYYDVYVESATLKLRDGEGLGCQDFSRDTAEGQERNSPSI